MAVSAFFYAWYRSTRSLRTPIPAYPTRYVSNSHYGYIGAPLKTPSVTCSEFLRFQVRPSISRNTLTCSGVEARLRSTQSVAGTLAVLLKDVCDASSCSSTAQTRVIVAVTGYSLEETRRGG